MKYFTKEELEDITKELLENPTRETLKNLNEKYNGNSETITTNEEPVIVEESIQEVAPTVVEAAPLVNNEVDKSEATQEPEVISPIPAVEIEPIINSIPEINVPSIETPSLNTPNMSTPNNEIVNFTGNLFEPTQQVSNLMQTTDNFNSSTNTMPTTDVPVTTTPFFGTQVTDGNNPIPVGGPVNNMPNNQSTMFGQIEQNYM